MKVKDILPGYPILEMLDTTFDAPLTWNRKGNIDTAIGTLGNDKFKLNVTAITYDVSDVILNGLNLTFATNVGGDKYDEAFGTISTQHSAKIIGAITNAFKERIQDYHWDFIVLVAKDNNDSRIAVYKRIANRLFREIGLVSSEQERNGATYVVLYKREVKQHIDAALLKLNQN